jgi:hypothetical protein
MLKHLPTCVLAFDIKKEKKMFKEFLTNNWFFVGMGFIVVFAIGCYLWFQIDLANFRHELAPLDEEMNQPDKSAETEQSGNLQAELTDTDQSVKNIPVSKNVSNAPHIATEDVKTDTDSTLEGMNAETATTEETEENLSPEELRERELGKRLKEIFAQMKALSIKEGGKVNASSSPQARRKMQQLTAEMFQIMQEGAKEEDKPVLTFFTNLMTMSNRLVNANGELVLSEYIKMADQMKAAGMDEMAKGIRGWAQNALDNGHEVIRVEEIQSLIAQGGN